MKKNKRKPGMQYPSVYDLNRIAPGHRSHTYAPRVAFKPAKISGEQRRELLRPPSRKEIQEQALQRENLCTLFNLINKTT
jgi:hypothetical protein